MCTTLWGIYGNEVNPAVGMVRMMIVPMAGLLFMYRIYALSSGNATAFQDLYLKHGSLIAYFISCTRRVYMVKYITHSMATINLQLAEE